MKVRLEAIAHARSGDKGNLVNIGVIAYEEALYPALVREVSAEKVRAYFADLIQGEVIRYEMPNIAALNFVCQEALDGGGTLSLRSDAQGKSFGGAILGLEIEVSEEEMSLLTRPV
ncbi:MAG: hypothetical protein OHK0021_17730 [Bryobacter sp.]